MTTSPRTILVTGGTGTLGRLVVPLLPGDAEVRVLSRRPGPDRVVGDLRTGQGLPAALDGVDTVLHLATDGRHDVSASLELVGQARRAGSPRIVLASIVGIDRHPFPYYRQKLAVEHLLERSGLPHVIQRATQFHELIERLMRAQRRLPVAFAPDIPIQPIAGAEVAARIAELATTDATGRAADLAGPEVRRLPEFAREWLEATGSRRRVVPLVLPGRSFRAFAQGRHLGGDAARGSETFEEFLARQ